MAAAKGATVALLNAVPLKKFPLLLKRIIERLGASTRDAFFDDAEERQLAGLLGVAPKDLRRAVGTALAAVNLHKWANVQSGKFSGGMKRVPKFHSSNLKFQRHPTIQIKRPLYSEIYLCYFIVPGTEISVKFHEISQISRQI